MSYVALYRRWRPTSFADLVGQEHISRTLSRAVTSGQTSHAYLFTGPRGTGKTSTAKILARSLNCAQGPTLTPCGQCESCRAIADGSSMDVFEIDAASNRGIDEIRDLRETVKFAPTEGRCKIYIIDEVHMLTTEAFNALLKTLEEPPPSVLFILATTEPHKVPATIQSRCQRYDFHRITVAEIRERLSYVCRESGIAANDDALSIIAAQADGGMRDALSILDQCSALAEGTLTAEQVQEALGLVGKERIARLAVQIADKDGSGLLAGLSELLQSGRELNRIFVELALHFRALMIAGVGGASFTAEFSGTEAAEQLRADAARFSQPEIMNILRRISETLQEMRTAPQPRITAETLLLSLCRESLTPADSGTHTAPAAQQPSVDTGRIARLEAQVQQLTAALAAVRSGTVSAPAALASAASPKAVKLPAARAPQSRGKAAAAKPPDAAEKVQRTLDMELWQRFSAQLGVRDKLAASLLSGAAYEGMTERQFFIRPARDIARKFIRERHRGIFEEVMTKLVGRAMEVVCTGDEEEQESVPIPAAPQQPEYPAQVKDLLSIAGAGARVEEIEKPARQDRPAPPAAPTRAVPEESSVPYDTYEPTPDEEAEMFDELPDDEET
ncbi:DNA polymerase III, subunit gamma and tau [Selenomonas sp. oral taxon 137 str. F0430]|uniref:DNA polymerase III subunit gamma/tau n=1 Tax=Selenomonas sp. oral taxon 137 TaxID=712531 RepID=UPI0001EB24BC|nr:DNA polymerase III subunit gamma/tau [Selenomonas sp. oral taxon 137]EFR41400.1 DNA polymerase III, subunit gamma and tau [Selenomonas sp. oral taxon 137 str. F0430]